MGFNSSDDLMAKLTAPTPQYHRAEFSKLFPGMSANYWYDTTTYQGTPPAPGGVANQLGEWVFNGSFDGGANGWNLGNAWERPTYWIIAPATTSISGETSILDLAVWNDSLYGSTGITKGELYRYDVGIGWVLVAPQLGTVTRIQSLAVWNDALYGGTDIDGLLYRYDVGIGWVQVSSQLGSATDILSLCVWNGALYGGAYPNGMLYRYDVGVGWVQVAAKLGAETSIVSLATWNGDLYGGTSPNGMLYRYDVGVGWVQVADILGTETAIYSLATWNGDLYGGTNPNGMLYRYDVGVGWVQVAAKYGTDATIHSLAEYNGALYGGTGEGGQLLRYRVGYGWSCQNVNYVEARIYSLRVWEGALYGGTWSSSRLFTYNSGHLASQTISKIPGSTDPLVATMNREVIPGTVYRVTWSIASITPAGGQIHVSLGGAVGSNYSTVGQRIEYLTAADTTPLQISTTGAGAAELTCTIDYVSVVAVHQAVAPYGSSALPLGETCGCGIYHGGDVSPKTKHVLNASCVSGVGIVGTFLLIDQLLVYSGISLTTAALQTLDTGLTLPRYTDGVGVRAYLVGTVNAGATPQNIELLYTNSVAVAGRTLPTLVKDGAGSLSAGRILSGAGQNSPPGAFLPLAMGDLGIRSVESVQMSVANGTGEAALVLCKPLLVVPMVYGGGLPGESDMLNRIPSLPRIYDGANLQWLFMPVISSTANQNVQGYLDLGWG